MTAPERNHLMVRHGDNTSLETDIELLKAKLYAAENEVQKLNELVDHLRLWQAYVLGAAAAAGALTGAAVAFWAKIAN